jgi:hypothetical protein
MLFQVMVGAGAQPTRKIRKKERVSPAFFLIVSPPGKGSSLLLTLAQTSAQGVKLQREQKRQ